jgi:hypothetical protein
MKGSSSSELSASDFGKLSIKICDMLTREDRARIVASIDPRPGVVDDNSRDTTSFLGYLSMQMLFRRDNLNPDLWQGYPGVQALIGHAMSQGSRENKKLYNLSYDERKNICETLSARCRVPSFLGKLVDTQMVRPNLMHSLKHKYTNALAGNQREQDAMMSEILDYLSTSVDARMTTTQELYAFIEKHEGSAVLQAILGTSPTPSATTQTPRPFLVEKNKHVEEEMQNPLAATLRQQRQQNMSTIAFLEDKTNHNPNAFLTAMD